MENRNICPFKFIFISSIENLNITTVLLNTYEFIYPRSTPSRRDFLKTWLSKFAGDVSCQGFTQINSSKFPSGIFVLTDVGSQKNWLALALNISRFFVRDAWLDNGKPSIRLTWDFHTSQEWKNSCYPPFYSSR